MSTFFHSVLKIIKKFSSVLKTVKKLGPCGGVSKTTFTLPILTPLAMTHIDRTLDNFAEKIRGWPFDHRSVYLTNIYVTYEYVNHCLHSCLCKRQQNKNKWLFEWAFLCPYFHNLFTTVYPSNDIVIKNVWIAAVTTTTTRKGDSFMSHILYRYVNECKGMRIVLFSVNKFCNRCAQSFTSKAT